MKPSSDRALCALQNGMLRTASFVVPAGQRSEWRREWHAELWHVRHSCCAGGALLLAGAARNHRFLPWFFPGCILPAPRIPPVSRTGAAHQMARPRSASFACPPCWPFRSSSRACCPECRPNAIQRASRSAPA